MVSICIFLLRFICNLTSLPLILSSIINDKGGVVCWLMTSYSTLIILMYDVSKNRVNMKFEIYTLVEITTNIKFEWFD